jgi:hypothetical protein
MICNNKYAVMHNGILDIDTTKYFGRSDTFHFCHDTLETILSQSPEVFDEPSFAVTLGKIIGSNNKMLILRNDGKVVIANKSAGVEIDEFWLSNAYSILKQKNMNIWDQYENDFPNDLDDLASLDEESLADFLYNNPERSAEIIHNYFGKWGRDYR